MPIDPNDRMSAARDAWEQYQLANTMGGDLKYAKTRAGMKMALNRNDPNSLISQVITGAGGDPQDYTTGALIGKGIKSLSQLGKK